MPTKKASTNKKFASELGEFLDDGFLLVNLDQEIILANTNATRHLGENLIGQNLSDVLIAAVMEEEFTACTQSRKQVEFVASTHHDKIHRFRIRMIMVDDETVCVLVMDMTLQHNLEKVRRDFVANVSHELRSPLTSLIGFIETMQNTSGIDDETRDKFLGIMEEESQRMSRLINDLLSLSRVETKEHVLPQNPLAIDKLVHSAIASMSNRAHKVNRTIVFHDNSDLGLDDVMVNGEHDELTEVFHNLLDNAIKYGFDNYDIQVEMTAPNTKTIAFTVINQGEGIDEKHFSRLTERFYRVDKGRSRQMGGTGLGLAIVKHIVNRHRGHINVASAIGGETRFMVTLPRI